MGTMSYEANKARIFQEARIIFYNVVDELQNGAQDLQKRVNSQLFSEKSEQKVCETEVKSSYTVFGKFKEFHQREETILCHINLFLPRPVTEV